MTNKEILELAKSCGFDSFTGEKVITGSVGKTNSWSLLGKFIETFVMKNE